MQGPLIFFAIFAVIVLITILKTAIIVPQKTAYIVERLGKYRCTLEAGFHILVPFIDRIAYRHTLKEQAIDVPPQECITKDNIAVSVDGILYMQVMDPAKASYGIGNYLFATTQLAQTTMRSEMGKLDLDRSFEETADGWRMVVPQKYEIGHEAHFSQVMNMYLGWMKKGEQPTDYLPNMLVKYYTLAEAWKASRK